MNENGQVSFTTETLCSSAQRYFDVSMDVCFHASSVKTCVLYMNDTTEGVMYTVKSVFELYLKDLGLGYLKLELLESSI